MNLETINFFNEINELRSRETVEMTEKPYRPLYHIRTQSRVTGSVRFFWLVRADSSLKCNTLGFNERGWIAAGC